MSNKKHIKNIIIGFIILLIILIICINILQKNNGNKSAVDEEEKYFKEEYFKENIISRDKYEYNEFEYYNITTDQLLLIYLNKYKYDCFYDTQAAFNSLDEEYKNKRFGTYENYLNYLNEQRDNIIDSRIQTYKINEGEDYEEYILNDQFGKTYIFKVTAVMEYKVMLDTYTVPTLSFLKAYNEAENEEKAALNLNKFLEAIEAKDYKYAYNKLYSTFKNNNFPTQTDFENYVTQNWLEYKSIDTINVENQSGVYICKLKILEAENQYIEKTFMVQLGAGTEYEVSFTI